MSVEAEELITRNLIAALDRLHEDLDRVELWTAALGCFAYPVPEYEPGGQYRRESARRRGPPRPCGGELGRRRSHCGKTLKNADSTIS
jgi:hypothetical protein